MKKFNNFERGVLIKLLESYQSSDFGIKPVKFLQETILWNRTISLDSKHKQITVGYNKELDNKGPAEIFNCIALIEHLEKNGLVFTTENSWHNFNTEFLSHNLTPNLSNFNTKPNNNWDKNSFMPNLHLTFPKGYFEKVIKFYNVDMFLSSELIDLISNDFETLESKTFKQAERQTNLSYLALFLSIITLIATILISHFSNSNKVTIDESQLETIITPLKSIDKELKINKKLLMKESDSLKIKNNKSKK